MKKKTKIILFLLSILILLFLLKKTDLREILEIISKANLLMAFLGIILYLCLVFFRSLKWFLLTKEIKKEVKYSEVLPIFLINSFLGNITPLKSGGVLSPFLFKKYLKISEGQGFSVMMIDMFFEIIVFCLLLLFSLFYIINSNIKNQLSSVVFKELLFLVILMAVFACAILFSKKIAARFLRIFSFFKKNPFLNKIIDFFEKQIESFYQTIILCKEKKSYYYMIPLTIAVWLFEILSFYLIFASVSPIPFLKITTTQIIAAAATFLVLTPAGIGVAELSIVFILSLFGYPYNLILAGTLLTRFLLTGTLFLTGFSGFLLIKNKEAQKIDITKLA